MVSAPIRSRPCSASSVTRSEVRSEDASPDDRHPRLIVLSGPSGVGKDTLVDYLRNAHPELWLSVSATTRAPRPSERHGVHYYFVDDAGFDRLIGHGELLEWAEFSGHRYGTLQRPVLDKLAAGVSVLLVIELAGARQVRVKIPEALLVFLAPPSWKELVRRLTQRATEPAEVMARRLAAARTELAAAGEFDITLVNNSVEEVARQLIALMATSRKSDGDG